MALLRLPLLFVLILVLVLSGFYAYLKWGHLTPDTNPQIQMSQVWVNYPFQSKYISVLGHAMHYVDEGPRQGPTFLLLHGNPTSSYLWRNVIPELVGSGFRVVAIDNIGFGASDKPDIDYNFADHSNHLAAFVEQIGLESFVVVSHDWGSALGFDYAFRHPHKVSGIAFMEAILTPDFTQHLNEQAKSAFAWFKTPVIGDLLILGMNIFIEGMLPNAVYQWPG